MTCGAMTAVVASLMLKYGEQLVMEDGAMALWMNGETRTYTITEQHNDMLCILSYGKYPKARARGKRL